MERKQQDSSRDLLEELEDGWGTPSAPHVVVASPQAPAAPKPKPPSAEALAALEETDDVDKLDDGWLDELFPIEDEPEEEEEFEPELPDERLDPVAFAAAKKARDERASKKKDKKRAKLDAKRSRQRAKAQAMRQKQKSKKARSPSSTRTIEAAPRAKRSRNEKRAAEPDAPVADATDDDGALEPIENEPERKSAPAKTKTKTRPSTVASVKTLAIVLGALVVLAIAAAVLFR
jgi:hypothetical protein